jgi:hypothetical protein
MEMKTDEKVFLDWCKRNKLVPKPKVYYANIPEMKEVRQHHYELNYEHKAFLTVQGHVFKMNKSQDSDSVSVDFDDAGKWTGGTNTLWNNNLLWER